MCYVSGVLTPAHTVSPDRPDGAWSLPLVLLPGTLCDERVFAPMLACLRKGMPDLECRVLRIDGCRLMTDVVAFVLQHAPERFVLLGFSLGGIAALHVAAEAPERVRGLALLDSTALPVPETQHASRRARAAEAHQLGLRRYLEQHLWPDYVAVGCQGNSALREQMHQMACALGVEALQRQTELAISRPDARFLLHALAMPALVLAGEEDRVCPPEAQQALAAALPNATLAMVPGAGHFALMEKPDVVAAHVAAWFHSLVRTEAGRAGENLPLETM